PSWGRACFLSVPLAAIVTALTARFVDESRDVSRTSRVDWAGASLAVLGLGGVVFALLDWTRAGAAGPVVYAALAGGLVSLAAFLVVERSVPGPMLPLGLFTSRTFTLANLLTLLL